MHSNRQLRTERDGDTEERCQKSNLWQKTTDDDGGGSDDDDVGQKIRFWTPAIRKVSMAGRSCLNDPCGSTKLVTVVVTVI